MTIGMGASPQAAEADLALQIPDHSPNELPQVTIEDLHRVLICGCCQKNSQDPQSAVPGFPGMSFVMQNS